MSKQNYFKVTVAHGTVIRWEGAPEEVSSTLHPNAVQIPIEEMVNWLDVLGWDFTHVVHATPQTQDFWFKRRQVTNTNKGILKVKAIDGFYHSVSFFTDAVDLNLFAYRHAEALLIREKGERARDIRAIWLLLNEGWKLLQIVPLPSQSGEIHTEFWFERS